jgi:acyl carrier protein
MQTIDIIREYVCKTLLQRNGSAFNEDALLIEDGYLTSLEAVDLAVFLEERFGVEVDPEDVNEEDFRSLRSVAAMVERKRSALDGVGA